MIHRGKRSILGVDVSVIDCDGAAEQIITAAHAKRPLGVSALAVHGVMTGALDTTHKARLNRIDIVAPDGQPVRWALKLLHHESLPDRVYGPDLTLRVCELAAQAGLSIYLYGSRLEVLEKLRKNLCMRFSDIRIVGVEPSKFRRGTAEESAALDERVRLSGADIILVGLGCPRQEVFVYEHVEALSRPLIAVGAAFDFHAGLLKQAPKWMQDRGFEWLFRLWVEPRRLWRRYLYLNPLYCLMIAAQYAHLLDFSELTERIPSRSHRYYL
jgi:N-acetylglucosaminyldiphosphoundecaprenol N-acetyl-beta-D-mannosaminyltransferase